MISQSSPVNAESQTHTETLDMFRHARSLRQALIVQLLSQRTPMTPGRQVQVNPFTWSWHVPSLHEWGSYSLMFTSQYLPAKPGSQSQLKHLESVAPPLSQKSCNKQSTEAKGTTYITKSSLVPRRNLASYPGEVWPRGRVRERAYLDASAELGDRLCQAVVLGKHHSRGLQQRMSRLPRDNLCRENYQLYGNRLPASCRKGLPASRRDVFPPNINVMYKPYFIHFSLGTVLLI